ETITHTSPPGMPPVTTKSTFSKSSTLMELFLRPPDLYARGRNPHPARKPGFALSEDRRSLSFQFVISQSLIRANWRCSGRFEIDASYLPGVRLSSHEIEPDNPSTGHLNSNLRG